MRNVDILIINICDTPKTRLLPASSRVNHLKSANTKISLVTIQSLTRGLFKRLDGVIAWAEEITNPRLPFNAEQAAFQLLSTRYGF
jgi:hypothetical protein